MTSTPPVPGRLGGDPLFPSGLPSAGGRSELEDAVARLRALRDGAGTATPDAVDASHGGADADADADTDADTDADALAERLRARRSVGQVAAAYTAVHGHALTTADDARGRRWALSARTALVAAAAVLALAVGAATVALWPRNDVSELAQLDAVDGPAVASAGPSSEPWEVTSGGRPDASGRSSPASGAGSVVVHVVGRVAEPGLVTVAAGARVADALEGAGGPTGKADLAALNLARIVVDGEQIYVPAVGEVGATGPAVPSDGSGTGSDAAGVLDLNTADATALDALPGIGPVLAERIVAWRTDNGPFTSVDELTEVSGIGPSVLAKLRDSVRV